MIESGAHWRDSARAVKFFILDGEAVLPLVLVLIFPRWWTLAFALVATLFFIIMKKYGFTTTVFLKVLRGFFSGHRVYSSPWWEE